MNASTVLDRLPVEQRDSIRVAIGTPTELLAPRIVEPLAGVIVGVLLIGAGVIQFVSYVTRAPGQLWCLLGVGMALAGGALVFFSWRYGARLPRLVVGPEGFALSSRTGLTTCRWDQIAQVIADEFERLSGK